MLTNLDLNAARELDDLIGLSEGKNELAFVFCDPVTKDPAFREALRHFDSSDYIRALGKLRPLLGQYPPSAYYFCLLGISAARTGAHSDAIAAFQSAMRLDLTTVGNWVAGASLGSSELFSGGDGSAPQEAVVINVFSTAIGIPAEYAFLEREYGEQNKDWKVSERQVLEEGNRVIERFSIATKGGQTRSMFFDATSFYGKW